MQPGGKLMSKLRALTIEEYLGIDTEEHSSKEVLDLVCAKVNGITDNTLVATYVALELMFRFGWELAELSRLTRIRDLSGVERREADEILLRL
jgi:hypothetical protein